MATIVSLSENVWSSLVLSPVLFPLFLYLSFISFMQLLTFARFKIILINITTNVTFLLFILSFNCSNYYNSCHYISVSNFLLAPSILDVSIYVDYTAKYFSSVPWVSTCPVINQVFSQPWLALSLGTFWLCTIWYCSNTTWCLHAHPWVKTCG